MTKPNDIKAFSFLDRDPRQVADQLLRAGWTREMVVNVSIDIGAWKIAIVDAFCAAEEAGKEAK